MKQSDSDLLRRAAATMRAERTGHNPGSGFTRARVLNDLRVQRRKRHRWWRVGFPLGVILVGTTAWASANGTLPAVWLTVSSFLNLPVTDNGVSERAVGTAQPRRLASGTNLDPNLAATSSSVTSEAEPGTSAEVEPAASADALDPTDANQPASPARDDSDPGQYNAPQLGDLPSPTTSRGSAVSNSAVSNSAASNAALSNAATAKPALRTAALQNRDNTELQGAVSNSRDPIVAPESPPARTSLYPDVATPAMEAEIRAFRVADDLYRRHGQLDAAVDAYRRYVRDYPTGRFVPEAKYNTALALLKLGRKAEARPLLIPFADGLYGTYRRDAARKLLDAIE